MQIQIFQDFNNELKLLWQDFEANAKVLVFQSYEWQKYWYEQIGKPEYDISICVTVVSIENQIRTIFPLGVSKKFGARVLEFMGADQADYNAPLIANGMGAIEFTKIWKRILGVLPPHDVIYFKNIPEAIRKSDYFLLGNVSTKKVGSSFFATLPNSKEAYFTTLSKRMLKDNKKMTRKLSEMGKLRFLVIDNYSNFDRMLDIGLSQKSSRYNLTEQRNIFQNKSVKRFFTNIYDLKKSGLNVHLSALVLDEEVLATHLGILYQDRLYYLLPTFSQDSKWKKYSLGRIHLEKLTAWAIDNKVREFDFTIGSEAYKKQWCNNEMDIYRYFKMRSFRGIMYLIYYVALELIKGNDFTKNLVIQLLNMSHKTSKN